MMMMMVMMMTVCQVDSTGNSRSLVHGRPTECGVCNCVLSPNLNNEVI